MLPSSSAEGERGDVAPPPFQLPPPRHGRKFDWDLFRFRVSADPSDEFWAARPYTPHAHEASLVTFGLGLVALLMLLMSVWVREFVVCLMPFGITSILAGAISASHPYNNPWWRLPPLLTLGFGVLDIVATAALLGGFHLW